MKKYIKYALYCLLAVTLLAAWGCSDDNDRDKEQEIALNQLPPVAHAFIGQYFNGDEVARIINDLEDGQTSYEVYLSSGTKIEFDSSGNWTDIEVAYGASVPDEILPAAMAVYLSSNYPGVGVHEIDVEPYGFDVELNNGIELIFDSFGNIIRIDR